MIVSTNRFKKNKYIYVLGYSKSEHKKLIKLLKVNIIKEYPKGNLKYYNNCLHLNQESTHPYGWMKCNDCGELLIQ